MQTCKVFGSMFVPSVWRSSKQLCTCCKTASVFHRKCDENHRKMKAARNGWRDMTTQIRHLQTYKDTEKHPFGSHYRYMLSSQCYFIQIQFSFPYIFVGDRSVIIEGRPVCRSGTWVTARAGVAVHPGRGNCGCLTIVLSGSLISQQ